MPGVLAGAVFAFITSFDEVVTALFLSNPFLRTVPVKMYSTLEDVDPTIAAASTLILGLTTAAILVTYLAGRSGRRSSLRARSTSALSPTS
jgi:putative spermidine/putrescine transport system permease protein